MRISSIWGIQAKTIFRDRAKTYGYVRDRYHSLEIDEPIDFHWAQYLIDNGYIDMSDWRWDSSEK